MLDLEHISISWDNFSNLEPKRLIQLLVERPYLLGVLKDAVMKLCPKPRKRAPWMLRAF